MEVNRTELEAVIAEKTSLPRRDVSAALTAAFEVISDAMRRGEDVRLVNFGSFSVTRTRPKEGRNPRTGERMTVPASTKARWKPSAALAASLDDGKRVEGGGAAASL